MFTRLAAYPRIRSAVKVMLDLACIFAASMAACLLHLSPAVWRLSFELSMSSALYAGMTIFALWLLKAYRSLWRYAGTQDMVRVAAGAVIGAATCLSIGLYAGGSRTELTAAIDRGLLSILLLCGMRAGVRMALSARRYLVGRAAVRHVLIFGADDESAAVARELFGAGNGRRPVGFLDDDPTKRGRLIHGIPVLGGLRDLSHIAARKRIDELVIAGRTLSPQMCGEIVSACADAGIRMRVVPSLLDLFSRSGAARRIQGIDPQSLLGRPTLPVEDSVIQGLVRDSVILVSGAGGSIGSELCRQIARHSPRSLYMLDQSENGIFDLEQELAEEYDFPLIPVICDVKDRAKLDQVVSAARPSLVVHAAAHKHVPLMETYPEEAVKNNILGTLSIAASCAAHSVGRFVLISTDKAVRPSSVMGASKRVAEMIVQDVARSSDTRFITVRFGNVLGSSGSVVPAIQGQIMRGGPVRVTHPEMTRYFMTIPEAARLVLLAASQAESGDLIVLDMGRPVRIMDLANLLIRLSGHEPGVDMHIAVTGPRPGEKLHEELLTKSECGQVVRKGGVMVSRSETPPAMVLERALARLQALALAADRDGIIRELQALVPDYTPGRPAFSGQASNPARNAEKFRLKGELDVNPAY